MAGSENVYRGKVGLEGNKQEIYQAVFGGYLFVALILQDVCVGWGGVGGVPTPRASNTEL